MKKKEKLFNEDEILFFKALLVEKAGYNLRHKVAHSLIQYDEYSIGIAHLLVLLLLRLGEIRFSRIKVLKKSLNEHLNSQNTQKE